MLRPASLCLAISGLFVALAPSWAQSDAPTIPLKVMSFNIWYGGDNVNLASVAEAIRLSGADIVGLQETDGNLAALAEATGLVYYDKRRNIISRYPIFDPALGERIAPGAGPYSMPSLDPDAVHALVLVAPGKVVAMANTHLTSDPYGPEAVLAGQSADDVIAIETEQRLPEAQMLADGLAPVIATGMPVFLTGDFNAPSHRDWTAAMTTVRPQVKFPLDWPVSKLMEEIGFLDSYRAVHPDPTQHPGLTWSPGAPHPLPPADGTQDRIDFVWSAGAEPLQSQLIGEAGGPDVDLAITPYPSDHRAVVTTFDVTPVDAPAMISVEPTRVVEGETFILRASIPGAGKWGGVVVPRDGDAAKDGLTGIANVGLSDRPTIKLSTNGLAAGAYDAVLLDEADTEQARTRFTIVGETAQTTLTLDKSSYAPNETIGVTWSAAEGNRFDWIAVYALPNADVYDYWAYAYTGARIDGTAQLDAAILGELPPGQYEARLMSDDHYVVQAAQRFEVKAP